MRSVTEQMDAIFRNYPNEINNIVDEESLRAAKETADRLKSTSPGKGKYASSWKVARDPDTPHGHVVYNTKYQLTHLLELGHLVSNQFGSYAKRVPAYVHIAPAEEAGKMSYELKLRVRISRGLK